MNFLNEHDLNFLYTVTWFQEFLSNTNISICYQFFAHSEVITSFIILQ